MLCYSTHCILRFVMFHYVVTLRYATVRYVALRHVTLRYATLRYVTLHYITLHYITLHYIILYYIILYYIILYYIILYYIILYYIILYYIILYYIILYYIILYYIILYYIILYYIILYYIILYYIIYPSVSVLLSMYTLIPLIMWVIHSEPLRSVNHYVLWTTTLCSNLVRLHNFHHRKMVTHAERDLLFRGILQILTHNTHTANCRRWKCAVSMLARSLRGWPNIETAKYQRLVFSGWYNRLVVKYDFVIDGLNSVYYFKNICWTFLSLMTVRLSKSYTDTKAYFFEIFHFLND